MKGNPFFCSADPSLTSPSQRHRQNPASALPSPLGPTFPTIRSVPSISLHFNRALPSHDPPLSTPHHQPYSPPRPSRLIPVPHPHSSNPRPRVPRPHPHLPASRHPRAPQACPRRNRLHRRQLPRRNLLSHHHTRHRPRCPRTALHGSAPARQLAAGAGARIRLCGCGRESSGRSLPFCVPLNASCYPLNAALLAAGASGSCGWGVLFASAQYPESRSGS